MRQYRAAIASTEENEKQSAYRRHYRSSNPENKRKNSEYMKQYRSSNLENKKNNSEYMKRHRASHPENKRKNNEYMKQYRASHPENKRKNNEYMKQYRASSASAEQKAKNNVYMKNYRATSTKNIQYFISRFHEVVSQGPVYICTCCDQLWYRHSVFSAEKLKCSNPEIVKHLWNKVSVKNIEWVCRTCFTHLVKNRIPPCAIVNGMKFPEKPAFFDLNELERRLLAPRIAFQKLMQAPRGKQFKLHGNIVNVPADVTNTVTMLPRLPTKTATIKVNLKRKLQFKSSAMSLNVRPHKVIKAAHWLMTNSDLYKGEGIMLHQDWENKYYKEISQHDNDNEIMIMHVASNQYQLNKATMTFCQKLIWKITGVKMRKKFLLV